MTLNKKGSGQVEIVLSFIIFIGFVIFLFAAFPVYRTEKSGISADFAEKGVMERVGVRVDSFTVILENAPLGSCFCFPASSEGRIVAKNVTRDIVGAKSDGNSVCIYGNEKFYQVYSSFELSFEEVTFDTSGCEKDLTGISLGLKNRLTVVSYKRMIDLKSLYESGEGGYESLREGFGIPKSENFGFRLTDLNGAERVSAVRNIPERVEVQTKSVPVQVAYNNGSFIFAELNIQIW